MENQVSKPKPENFASLPKLSAASSRSPSDEDRALRRKARLKKTLGRKGLARLTVDVGGLILADVLVEKKRLHRMIETIWESLAGSIAL